MRRDFLKPAISFPHLKAVAFVRVELIGELYHLNSIRVSRIKDQEGFLEADKKLRAAVSKMEQRLKDELEQQRLDADYKKVLESLTTYWEGLTVFVGVRPSAHPWVPMDNNEAQENIAELCGRTEELLRARGDLERTCCRDDVQHLSEPPTVKHQSSNMVD